MATATSSVPEQSADASGVQSIRITRQGKMNTWVAFALDFLEKNEERPVMLHTLPAPPPPPQAIPADATEPIKEDRATGNGSLSNATVTIPRLISVVEIIKREYIKNLEVKHSPKLTGLHQYNEIGCLEDLGLVPSMDAEGDRAADLAMALDGKNHVRQKQTPYMKVTLSQVPLPELAEKGATYQPPLMRKLTKSAKARAKKREREAKAVNETDAMDDV